MRRVVDQQLVQPFRVEHVDAHAAQRGVRAAGHRLRIVRLFDEAENALVGVDGHHAEGGCIVERNGHAADRELDAARNMLGRASCA